MNRCPKIILDSNNNYYDCTNKSFLGLTELVQQRLEWPHSCVTCHVVAVAILLAYIPSLPSPSLPLPCPSEK